MTKEEALAKAKKELELDNYVAETGINTGLRTIHENRSAWLSLVVGLAEKGLNNSIDWKNPSVVMPEDLPENAGRKSIPCLVCVKSRYPNGKPGIEKRMRQFNSWLGRWEWTKLRGDNVTHWAPMPYPKEYQNG